MSTLIDQDYVVISSSARNSHLNYQVKTEYKQGLVGTLILGILEIKELIQA